MRPPDRPNVKYIAVNTSDPDDPDEPVIKTKRRRKSGKYIFALLCQKWIFVFPPKRQQNPPFFIFVTPFKMSFWGCFYLGKQLFSFLATTHFPVGENFCQKLKFFRFFGSLAHANFQFVALAKNIFSFWIVLHSLCESELCSCILTCHLFMTCLFL